MLRLKESLGDKYAIGEGVPQDFKEAAKWYRLAAAQGLAGAQFELGLMYEKGQGVLQDYVKAHAWLNMAAVQRRAVWAGQYKDRLESKMSPYQLAQAHRVCCRLSPKHRICKNRIN